MSDAFYLLFELLTTIAKLLRPGDNRTIIAENLLLKQQLIIHSRSRQRAPNLTTRDRTLLGFFSLFLIPRRIARSAIIIKPSSRGGATPIESGDDKVVDLNHYHWKKHCRGLFQLPIAT
jgi:hypothetical protein